MSFPAYKRRCFFVQAAVYAALLGLLPVSDVLAQVNDSLTEARTLVKEQKLDDAEQIVRAFLKQNSTSASGHFLLGSILFRQKRSVDSLAEYTAGARYSQPDADDLMIVGADYISLEDPEDAARWFRKVTTLQPGNELALYYLGRALYLQGHSDQAVEAFLGCLRLKPNDMTLETNLGLAYQQQGRENEATSAFRQAIEWQRASGVQDGQPYLDLALLMRQQGQTEQGLPYFERAAQLEPNNAEAQFELGRELMEVRKLPEAEARLREASAIDPKASSIHYVLARVLKAEGRASDAEVEFKRAAELNGTQSNKDVLNFNLPATPH